MSIAEDFRAAVTHTLDAEMSGVDLMPAVLSRACVEVLPIAGAGLSITEELRVPLGSSDDAVALAERLQTTLGEGPCLTASADGEPVSADARELEARWPMFHRELLVQTPFRAVVSLPFFSRHRVLAGALDLYLTTPEVPAELSVRELLTDIADPIGAILFDDTQTRQSYGVDLPPWLDNAPASERMHVWVAVGILMEHAPGLEHANALAMLRGYAFRTSSTLDEVADGLMSQRVRPDAVN